MGNTPFFAPLGHYERVEPEVIAAASREAGAREMAFIRDMSGGFSSPKPSLPQLRAPRLPDDHAQRVANLDEKLYERGIAVSKDKLLSLGKARFQELLAAERAARSERVIGTRCDLTSFASVLFAFGQAGALRQLPVPKATMQEQLCGSSRELDEARQIESFTDLWKVFGSEPRAVKAVYAFRDIFESLVLGKSLLAWIEGTSGIHHKFFCSGSGGDKVRVFEPWLSALRAPYHRVKITNALAATVFWLAGEKSAPPDAHELAREWFGVRVPSPEQLAFATAVFEGVLLNHKNWNLWQFVGRTIRQTPDQFLVGQWSDEVRKRFPRINVLHRQLAGSFFKPVGDHHEFEPERHRAFVTATLDQLLNCISAVAALTIEENSPADSAPVAARFRDWILCSGKPKPQITEHVAAKLTAAFPGAAFAVEVSQ